VKKVAFDETGNTGQDLITVDQPAFCLASICTSEQNIRDVETLLRPVRAAEWKFSKFRRKDIQLKLIPSLLSMDWVSPTTVKIFVFHKRFLALTKIVDLILEPGARAYGIDLYQKGGALATANLLATLLPAFLGQTRLDRFLNRFVHLIRRRDADALSRFRRDTVSAYEFLERKHPGPVVDSFTPIILACDHPEGWLKYTGKDELDPLIPAYYVLADEWGKTLKDRFLILADDSKTLAKERDQFLEFAHQDLREAKIGSDTRNMEFPLKVADIIRADSRASRLIQVADLFAGVTSYAVTPIANRVRPDELARSFFELLSKRCWLNAVWPTAHVTPEELGTEDFVGETPVDYSMRILQRDRETRKSR